MLAPAFITVVLLAVASIVVALLAPASIAVAFIVVHPSPVAWRLASVLRPSVLLPQGHTEPMAAMARHSADIIPTRLATRALVAVIERSVTAVPVAAAGAGVGCLSGSNAPGDVCRDKMSPFPSEIPFTLSGDWT